MANIGLRKNLGLLLLVITGMSLYSPALARAALSVTVKNETGYDLAEVKYVQEVGNAKILAVRTGQLANGASHTFSLEDSGIYRIYASLIIDGKRSYARGNANNLQDGGRYTLTLMKVMLGQGGKGMNFINKNEFDAIGAKVGGVEAETEKSADVISTYFGLENKPSIRDIECFDLCKKEGHDCGFYSGTKGNISFKMALQSKGIIHNCICFVAVRKKASESRQSGQGITNNDMNLIKAAATGDTATVKLLLDKGADANAKRDNGVTALMMASLNGHFDVVKALLDEGADMNVKSSQGATALMMASSEGHFDVVKALLDKGAHLNAKANDNDVTALFMASLHGHLNVVMALLAKGADVNVKTHQGATSLLGASQNGHVEIVNALLVKGADVNAKRDNGATALMLAAQKGHVNVVKALLDKGADVNVKTNYGDTALKLANKYIQDKATLEEISRLLRKAGAENNVAKEVGSKASLRRTALGMLGNEGKLFGAKITESMWGKFRSSGFISIDSKNAFPVKKTIKIHTGGMIPPHSRRITLVKDLDSGEWLATNGYIYFVTSKASHLKELGKASSEYMLLDGDTVEIIGGRAKPIYIEGTPFADTTVDIRDGKPLQQLCNASSTLMIAVRDDNISLIKSLIDQGAEVNETDSDGYTPLYLASFLGHREVVAVLLAAGADVDEAAKQGNTPLHAAAFVGRADIVELLLDKGADVNAKNDEKNTPLADCAAKGYLNVARLLIAKGANVNARCKAGLTALSIAKMEGNTDMVELLKQHGGKE